MSDPLVVAGVAWVILAWLVVGFSIRGWGPGRAKRSVRCPEKNVRAKVSVLFTEADFGSVKATDVNACSLFGDKPLACDKACLSRL